MTAPIRSIGTRHNQWFGVDRTIAYVLGFASLAVAGISLLRFSFWTLGCAALVWALAMLMARTWAKADPLFHKVLYRGTRYQRRYPARPTPFRKVARRTTC